MTPRLDRATLAATAAVCAAGAASVVTSGSTSAPLLCSSSSILGSAGPLPVGLILAVTPPAVLAADWIRMLGVMTPFLVVEPLRHLRSRSLARRRAGATALFCLGYAAAWLAAGVALETAAVAAAAALGAVLSSGLGLAAALAWQVSPAKQKSLNACHRAPPLAAFGWAAGRDALLFGLSQGCWCVASCWASMFCLLLLPRGHQAAMAAAALFIAAERLDPPAPSGWRMRVPRTASRILGRWLSAALSGPPAAGDRRHISQ